MLNGPLLCSKMCHDRQGPNGRGLSNREGRVLPQLRLMLKCCEEQTISLDPSSPTSIG